MKGKVVLITGAAGGIGSATAAVFAQKGAKTILVDKNEERLFTVSGSGYLPINLEDPLSVDEIQSAVSKWYRKGISAAVFCHGGADQNVDKGFPADFRVWESAFRRNVITCVHAVHGCVGGLEKAGGGNIVIVSSVNAILALGEGPYDAAKAALSSLAMTITREHAPHICAIAVQVGTVVTEMAWGQRERDYPGTIQAVGNANCSGKVLEPQDVAQLLYLLSQPEARPMRGRTVIADNLWSNLAGTFNAKSDQPWHLPLQYRK